MSEARGSDAPRWTARLRGCFEPGPHALLRTRRLFIAWLGLAYFFAFASLAAQVEGLLGSEGIAPAAQLLERAQHALGIGAIWRLPSLLWIHASDMALLGLCVAGAASALLCVAGRFPRPALAFSWLAYLSLCSVGDVFLGYQWDALLLETGLLAVFLAPAGSGGRKSWQQPLPMSWLWLLRWLLFRLMFLSGWVKLASGDPTWQEWRALDFHYFTQPLPSWTSWYAHHLPQSFHTSGVAATLAIELLLPCLIAAGRRGRLIAAGGFALLQLAIASTGNYGFFNFLTVGLCLVLLDDTALAAMTPKRLPFASEEPQPTSEGRPSRSRWRRVPPLGLAVLLALLSLLRFDAALRRAPVRGDWGRALVSAAAPFQAVNAYGLFAVMTVERNEIIVEGSADGLHWVPYELPWKPGDPDRRPDFAGPHMPRLDWQLWFASLRGCQRAPWYLAFLKRVLEGSVAVRGLLDRDPFPDAPPRYLRSRFYRYEFADTHSRSWWRRRELRDFCPPVTLQEGVLVPAQALLPPASPAGR